MMNLRLKAIKFNTDFRKNEWTNFKEFKKSKRFPGELKANEAILFVSKSGNQLIWILNVADAESGRQIVDSRRWRITGSQSWNPMMLQNYAEKVGIHLVGLKRFEELYEADREKKRKK